jgi:hypothetical protein
MWDFETPLSLPSSSSGALVDGNFISYFCIVLCFIGNIFAGPFYPAVMRPSSHQGRVSAGQFATYWDFTAYEALRATTTDQLAYASIYYTRYGRLDDID